MAFDRTFAESQGLPVRWIEYGMMALIALTIVATLRMVGIVLALSLLTIPQMTANLFTFNYKSDDASFHSYWLDRLLVWACHELLVGCPFGCFDYLCKYHCVCNCKVVVEEMKHVIPYFIAFGLVVTLLLSCSMQQNTAKSRWWHAFNTRYNVYYNGSMAYVDGSLEKENGNKDNFTEIIPLYTVGNKESRSLGETNFNRAIEKCEKAIKLHSIKRHPVWDKNRRKTAEDIEWLNRKEYNPFLWKVWMLMGRSQFHEGNFEEAVSTFAYMSRLLCHSTGYLPAGAGMVGQELHRSGVAI